MGTEVFARCFLLVAVPVTLSGCGVTLSPVKRAPVEVTRLETTLNPIDDALVVRLDSTIPGKSLLETVWDNVSGAFADAKESQQIGFTQNYSMLIPAAAVGGAVGGAAAGTQPSYTRIVIPFGRIFAGVFQSGLDKVFPNSSTCFDVLCEQQSARSRAPAYVTVKVVEFRIWEKPLNHINLKALVECAVHRGGAVKPAYRFGTRHEMTNQSVGSIMTTSSGFIAEMNKISNAFAAALSEKILAQLQSAIRGMKDDEPSRNNALDADAFSARLALSRAGRRERYTAKERV